jgi:hypothetical protein
MNTRETITLPPEVMADIQAVANAVDAGRPVDLEVVRRVQQRSQESQETLLRQHGVREIAVDLIRQGREE